VQRDGFFKVDNASVLITIAAFVLLLACLPLALRLDEGIDRDRPMYTDLSRMATLQNASLVTTGAAVPVELSGGETAEIGEQEFVASEGVSIVVTGVDDDTGYCISVSNEHGASKDDYCS
jgi:hypothetical protein